MLKELKLKNIKSFEEATLPLSNFTLLIGTNASGKSNIGDALKFVHGLSRGYKLVELLAGKYDGGDKVWSGVRGGPNDFIRWGSETGSVDVGFWDNKLAYHIILESAPHLPIQVREEWLKDGPKTLFETSVIGEADLYVREGDISVRTILEDIRQGRGHGQSRDEPALSKLSRMLKVGETSNQVNDLTLGFSTMRFLDLSPAAMREPYFFGPLALGDSGENLSTVLRNLVESEDRERDILEWLRVLTPMDVAALEFDKDARGRVSLVLVEHDKRRTPAESASDGTLRFLAYLALAFSTDVPTTCFVEELDNGIHPSRLRLLVELIEEQSKKKGLQVVATSHSPALLNLLSEDSLLDSLLVYRTEDSSASKVRPLRELPDFESIARRRQPGTLLEAGWFENTVEAMDFVEADVS